MEKRKPSYIVGGNINRYNHSGEQYGGSFKKLKTELPYDLETPFLSIPRENHNSKRYMNPNVHWSAVYSSQNIEARCHTHIQWNITQLYKEQNNAFAATWMNIEMIILSEVSHRKTNIISPICGI